MTGIDSVKKEFGDYQTPVSFAEEVCLLLKSKTDFVPDLILEPTCGVGNFLRAAAEYYPGVSMIGVNESKPCRFTLITANKRSVTYITTPPPCVTS